MKCYLLAFDLFSLFNQELTVFIINLEALIRATITTETDFDLFVRSQRDF